MRFALQPFPGATEAKASWGELDFKLDGKQYALRTASPMSGGNQPRSVWIKNEAGFVPQNGEPERQFLASSRLGAWLRH